MQQRRIHRFEIDNNGECDDLPLYVRTTGGILQEAILPPNTRRKMNRVDATKVFVATRDEGSLSGAARRLGRFPAVVSGTIAFVEEHTGAALLYWTTDYKRPCDNVLNGRLQQFRAASGSTAEDRVSLMCFISRFLKRPLFKRCRPWIFCDECLAP